MDRVMKTEKNMIAENDYPRNQGEASEILSKAMMYYNNKRYDDFLDTVRGSISLLNRTLNYSEFDKLLDNFYDSIKKSSRECDYIYDKIRVLHSYVKYDKCLELFETRIDCDFMDYIKTDIEEYRNAFYDEQFDRLLDYFYTAVKRSQRGGKYILDKIVFLYSFERYNQCIELLNDKNALLAKSLKSRDYNIALRLLRKSYFKSGKILRGAAFLLSAPFKYPTLQNISSAAVLTAIVVLCCAFILNFGPLYKVGLLKPVVVSVDLAAGKKIIAVGEKVNIKADIHTKLKDIKGLSPEFKSLNPDILQVDSDGTVTGLKTGRGKIAAIVNGKQTVTSEIELEVKKPEVLAIRLNLTNTRLGIGEETDSIAALDMNYEKALEPKISFVSSNPSVAIIDEQGHIKAISLGTAEISARSDGKEAKIAVNVVPVAASIKATLSKEKLYVGETAKISASVTMNPTSAKAEAITFSSSYEKILKVDSKGNIQALSPGDGVILVKCGEKSEPVNLTVMPVVKALKISIDTPIMITGMNGKIKVDLEMNPSDSSLEPVSFASSDENVVKVFSDGSLYAVKPGTAKITASAGNKTASINLTVQGSVAFESRELENAIREKLNKPQGSIYPSELDNITELNINVSSIDSIKGLQYLKNLKKVSWDGGNVYTGGFLNGKMNGEGVLQYADGRQFSGTFADGSISKGTMTYKNGDRFTGEWQGGKFTGDAVITYNDGNRYNGKVVSDILNGQGIMTYASGNKYEGTWKDGQYNGYGALTFWNGGRYSGGWLSGKFSGQGTLVYSDGASFAGDFLNGIRHGHGIMVYPDGAKYDGGWNSDKRSGLGAFSYVDGANFAGEWTIDGRGSIGKMVYPDGNAEESSSVYLKDGYDDKYNTLESGYRQIISALN